LDGRRRVLHRHFKRHAGTVAIVIAVLTAVGTEAKGIVFTKAKPAPA